MQNRFDSYQLYTVWTTPVVVTRPDGAIADGKNCVVNNRYPCRR